MGKCRHSVPHTLSLPDRLSLLASSPSLCHQRRVFLQLQRLVAGRCSRLPQRRAAACGPSTLQAPRRSIAATSTAAAAASQPSSLAGPVGHRQVPRRTGTIHGQAGRSHAAAGLPVSCCASYCDARDCSPARPQGAQNLAGPQVCVSRRRPHGSWPVQATKCHGALERLYGSLCRQPGRPAPGPCRPAAPSVSRSKGAVGQHAVLPRMRRRRGDVPFTVTPYGEHSPLDRDHSRSRRWSPLARLTLTRPEDLRRGTCHCTNRVCQSPSNPLVIPFRAL